MWWDRYEDGGLGRPREDGPLPPVGPWMQESGVGDRFLGGFRALRSLGEGLAARLAHRSAAAHGEQGHRH
jgi:sugar/nucleoside kinase (ribokinase family)